MQTTEMLSGLKILELAAVLAGPSVGQFFAELGAEVIKVENPKTNGDVTRSWKLPSEGEGDISAYFSSVNWGKKSVSLDVSTPEGKQHIYRLIEQVDIVIVSYKHGDDVKLGMDYDTLSRINPRLIYGKITGYGEANERVGYDAIIQAEAGFMFINGMPGGESLKMPVALVDVLAAHHLKEGILVALIQRGLTGKGNCVAVSLMDAAISSLVNQATNYLVTGEIPVKKGSQHPNIAPYGDVFTTKDNVQLLLAVGSDRQFESLCSVLQLNEMDATSNYATNKSRVAHRESLTTTLQVAFSKFDSSAVIKALNTANVPCGKIHNMKEVFETENAKSVLISSKKVPEKLQGIRNFVAKFNKVENATHFSPPPKMGEHTQEIL